jgi:PQQ-dependent catabolism-associated beta-propeller protein
MVIGFVISHRLATFASAFALLALAPHALAERLYVSNEDGHSVSVVDAAAGEVIATVPVGKRPRGLKLSRDGKRLFVAVSGSPKCPPSMPDEECARMTRDLTADGIAVVDTQALKLVDVLPAGSDPEQFDVSSDGRRLYVANEDAATMSVVDVQSRRVVARVPVGPEPEGVATTPDGKWVVVTSEAGNSVAIIDTRRLVVTRTLHVGKRPRDVAFTPDSRTGYVGGEFDASIYRIDVAGSKEPEKVVALRKEARPMGVVLDAARKRLYVTTGRGGTLAVIDVTSQPALIKEIAVGTRPWGLARSADGRRLYTANGPSDDVAIVDADTLEVTKRIGVGKSPWGIVVGE